MKSASQRHIARSLITYQTQSLMIFWKQLEDNNEVYLKDQSGNRITPHDLPASLKDLSNDPFRSLTGAVRESCGFEKGDKSSSGEDYLEFQWAIFAHTGRKRALQRKT